MAGRTIAVGDIHGCDVALEVVLAQLELAAGDTLVVLGDVVDRGPNTRRAIEQLIDVQRKCKLIFIMGNHEEMMLDALAEGEWSEGWLRYGGDATLESYGGDSVKIPSAHREFLQTGLDYWETDREIFIHANLEPGVALHAQHPEWLRWTHLTGNERPHPSGKTVICGHTPQSGTWPIAYSGWIAIDTHAYGGRWLTALDVDTLEVWQGNQAGESRRGQL